MFYHNDFIFVVGGSTNTTEKFDTKTLKWTKLASLVTEERLNPVLYVHNNYLYAFFGIKNGTYLDSVEKLNLKNVKSKWELVPYKKIKEMDLKMIGCGIITSGDKEIYLFGGKSKDGLKNSAVKFDFSSNSFDKVDLVLEDGIYFHESLLADLGDSSYGQFNTDKNENFFKVQLG
jgi:N-acetylneuraminic acid mutarotase